MSTFWVVAAALTLAVIAVLAVPLMRRAATAPAEDQDRSNLALFQDQLSELDLAGRLDRHAGGRVSIRPA